MVAEKKADGKNKSGEEETKKGVPFYKLFVFADTLDIILMIIGTIASVANGLAFPVMTILLGHLLNVFGNNMDIHRFIEFDAFGKNTDMHALLHEVSEICLQFLYVGAGAGVASFLQVAFWMCTGERQAIRLRCIYLKNILRQDIAFFDRETSTGEVMARMSADTVLIQDAMGEKIGKFIQFISTFLGGFVVASIRGWKLTLVILCMIPLVAIVGGVMAVIISKMSTKGQQAYAEAGNIVEQTIGAVRMVVSFTGEKAAVADYDKSLRIAYHAATYQGLAAGFCVGSAIFITFCSYAFALWYGSRLIVHEGYSGGRVINVIFAVMAGGMYLGQASPCLNAFAAGQAAAYKMFETINRKPEIDVYDTTGLVVEDIQGDIEFKDVYFRYPARPDVQIFSGFSLEIPKGSTTALVGESGSGKSTVLSLIERFYDPQSGEVLIDTVNIREFQLKWLRQKIGLVSQEPVLLATTIKDNITYGKDAATLEEIQAAAELASAAGFISKMPQGFDTMVGEHGTQLSGGQKQRIAIARAILKDPRILLLDEATSALDVESERLVQQAIDSIMINRTTVIVAHRLTTVRNADTIAVVEGGSIIEKGSHSQLITNPSSVYSQLIHLQEVHQSEQQYANKLEIHFDDSISKTIGMTGSPTSSPSRSMSSGSSIGGHHLPFTSPSSSSDRSVQVEESKRKNKLFNWFSSKRQVDVEDGQSGLVVRDIPVLTLATLNKPEAPVFILGSLAAAINGVTFPVFGLMLSRLIMSLYEPPSQLRTDVRFWSLMLVVLATTCFLVAPIQMYCFAVAGGRLVRRIRSLTFNKVVYQEIGWFDDTENSSGGLSARLSRDAQSVRSVVGDALSLVVQNISTIIAGIAIAFSANWKLALLILALVPLLGLQGWVQVKILRGFAADAKVTYQKASEVANAAVGSIRTVAAFSAEEKVMSLYDEKCTAPLKNGIQRGIVSGIGLGIANFLLFSVYAVSFWVGAWMIEHRETTFRNFFTVFIALLMAALGVSESTGLAPDIEKVKSSIISVFNILDRKSKIDASDVSGTILENVRGDIEFRHVSFRYPTRPDIQIFQDLSFFVHSGKTFALAGESGSGKSTIISLLERFYNPNSGWILFDGVEIQQLQLRWLRQQMGLVSQEPILLNDTIRANIAYGRHEMVSDEDIIAAAEASNCHHFISELTQGYDTWVGERGVQLSGGQKQRIAIARAIIRDPKILLLDEATSALDAESERTVQDALDKVMMNRTTIVVAHRLSTIMYADVIAVVKNGVIAEEGKHAELIADSNGIYASLVKLHMVAF